MTQYITHKNAAASPIVGVMLLLIMTVLLAAIVSSYAGSLTETRNKFPQVIIKPEIYKNATNIVMNIDVLSAGDGIPTSDLRIIIETKSGAKSVSGGNPENKYPKGRGAGVQGNNEVADFGDYMLLGGTLMYIDDTEGCNALFGSDWSALAENDLVRLRIIHIPSQTTIANQEILVKRVS
jgi:FlaG/FlaF family flagellin (archaellin)